MYTWESSLQQVQQVAWHPNGLVLATACTDFKCRVVSAVVEEVRDAFVLYLLDSSLSRAVTVPLIMIQLVVVRL